MANKRSGTPGWLLIIFGILVAGRIAMIVGRRGNGSANSTWDNTYLIWSVFLLIAIIVYYFWNQNQKNMD